MSILRGFPLCVDDTEVSSGRGGKGREGRRRPTVAAPRQAKNTMKQMNQGQETAREVRKVIRSVRETASS